MRDRVVYLGPANNRKQGELIDKAIEYLEENKGDKFYYLLPNEKLLKKYRWEFIDRLGSAFEINLFTFDDIVNKILENIPIKKIDNPMKNIIMKQVLEKLKSEERIIYYRDFVHMEGFIFSVNDIIGEIKRSLINPEEYLKKCPDMPNYREIGIIYREYEDFLNRYNLYDREGEYFKSIELLRDSEVLEDIDFIIIDEFYDFRPIELAILKELIKGNMDIYINMPFDMESKSIILNNTLDTLGKLDFFVECISKEEKTLFEKVAFNFFGEKDEKVQFDNRLKVINAPTPYLELRRVFEEIRKINRDGTSLEDTAIVISNPEYLEPLFKVAEEERMPINMNKNIPLRNIPIIRELLGILENKLSCGSKFKLINRIKSRYFSICDYDKREIYEYIIRRQKFDDLDGLRFLLKDNKSIPVSLEHLHDLEEMIHILDEELLEISTEDTVENHNRYLVYLLNKFQVVEKILSRYRESREEKLFLRDIRGIDKLYEVFDNLKEIPFLEEKISLEDYYFILEEYLRQEEILESEGDLKGISILNPVNSRGIQKDVIFITGLSQGNYPILDNNSYFINDYNMRELRKIGVEIESYMERLNNEILKFSSIVALCKDRLYISYSRGYEDTCIPSMFLDELLGLSTEEEIKYASIDVGLDYLIRKHIEPWKKSKIHSKLQGERRRREESGSSYSGLLTREDIVKDIHGYLNDVFSISYLESYSRCPYYFMLKNLLNIDEMERDYETYDPMDIGSIYHEVLRHYYQYNLKSIEESVKESSRFCVEDTFELLENLVYRYSRQHGLELDRKRDLLIVENIIDRLKNFIIEDLKRLSNWRLVPYGFEIDFGKKQEFIIEVEGKKVPMIGQIDRIDRSIDEDKYLLLDYKSSSYGVRDIDNMRDGLSLQLPVYIMSQKDKNIVAGGYGIVKNGKLEIKLGIVDETNVVTKRNKGALSREEWDEVLDVSRKNIIDIVENIQRGDFSVSPLECSSYCIYRDICRYEDILEVE